MNQPIKIFVNFAPEDQVLYKELEKHLKAARMHRDTIDWEWYSNEVPAGTDWRTEGERHLSTAHIILLLVSPDFMASHYYSVIQTNLAMKRHRRREAIVIPVILRSVDWEQAPFGTLQALPRGGIPVTDSRKHTQDEAFFNVVKGVFEVVNASVARKLRNDLLPSRPLLPFGMCLCPSCIREFYPGECRIVSEKTRGKVLKNPPHGWLTQRLKPESLTSSSYREEKAHRECPHCQYLLPYNIEQVDNISIAIIGDTFSGKSMYLASLLHQIKHQWVKKSKFLKISCLTENIEEFYNHHSSISLFDKGYNFPPTHPMIYPYNTHPLIYELTVSNSSRGQEKKVNLIFYDGSGEDYSSEYRIEHFSRYVLRASAIIFLLDPLQVSEISSRLPPYLPISRMLHFIQKRGSSYHFLSSTIELLKYYHPSAFASVPLAVMLSKSDLLRCVYEPTDPFFRCLTDSSNHYLNLQDIKDIDTKVKTLIRETSEHPLLEVTQRFEQTSFFVSSATGCPPDSSGNFSSLKPCRCLEPLLWILHQLKIIPAR